MVFEHLGFGLARTLPRRYVYPFEENAHAAYWGSVLAVQVGFYLNFQKISKITNTVNDPSTSMRCLSRTLFPLVWVSSVIENWNKAKWCLAGG